MDLLKMLKSMSNKAKETTEMLLSRTSTCQVYLEENFTEISKTQLLFPPIQAVKLYLIS